MNIPVKLEDRFYHDHFNRLLFIIGGFVGCIALIIVIIFYLHFHKPKPATFVVGEEWRVQPDVPITEPYLTTPLLLQWVSEVMRQAFTLDFLHYNDQMKQAAQFFTVNGWKVFSNQLNNYANYNNVQAYKLFISGTPASAPYILNQGLLSGRYAWWIQMPMNINYDGYKPLPSLTVALQVLVVRIPTYDNLSGVQIDNVVLVNTGNQ